jgi:hypothetical protein
MRQFKPVIVVAICSLALAGCAAWDVDLAPDRADKPWTPTTTTSGEIVPGAKPSKSPSRVTRYPSTPT